VVTLLRRLNIRPTLLAVLWLLVAAGVAGAGWFKSINLFVLAGYVQIALLGLNVWMAWRSATRVTARREPASPTFPGETAVLNAEVTNTSRRPVTAVVTDRCGEHRAAWLLAPLGPGETRRVSARWEFSARGRHVVGPMEVDGGYPFGLVHVIRPVSEPGEVIVLPPVGAVDLAKFRRWLIRGGAGDTKQRKPARRPALGVGDVRGVRTYRPGDSPRDIHWKTAARRGQLFVREYDWSEPLDLRVVVDPWLPAGTPPGHRDHRRLEWALSAAASLLKTWCEADEPADLTLVVPGKPPVVRAGRGSPTFVRSALLPLAELEGTPDVPPVPPELIRGRSNRTARLLVTTRPASPLGEALRRAGLPFVAVDPTAPPGWFTAPPSLALSTVSPPEDR
jgi:uncharacterized protein (DUF58 family)